MKYIGMLLSIVLPLLYTVTKVTKNIIKTDKRNRNPSVTLFFVLNGGGLLFAFQKSKTKYQKVLHI